MKSAAHNWDRLPVQRRRAGDRSGMTLIEMLVAMGVGMLVLALVAMLSVYALRSFTAMGHYADLEAKGRIALDRITRDIRQATGVIDIGQNGLDKWLRLTNEVDGVSLEYYWDAEGRKLLCDNGEFQDTYLTECDEWNFALYQRTPRSGSSHHFYPADKNTCKMIEMNWKCSRTMLGKKWNTECPQSVRVVLRTTTQGTTP